MGIIRNKSGKTTISVTLSITERFQFKGTVVNRIFSSLHEGSLENTLTFPWSVLFFINLFFTINVFFLYFYDFICIGTLMQLMSTISDDIEFKPMFKILGLPV